MSSKSKPSSGGKGKKGAQRTLIKSYARIKPIAADKNGGIEAATGLGGWDTNAGVVEIRGKGGAKVYSHYHAVIPPDATQEFVYDTVCSPLVRQWLDGYDVDLLSYGQTGSGKTYTMFGPPHSMATAAEKLGGGGRGIFSPECVMQEDFGFILRAGFEALAKVNSINSAGGHAVLHGSMVEMSIMSFTDQTVLDLLNKNKPCFVDKSHHLQGAVHVPLKDAHDLVTMAAAVESRTTRGTRMNDTSSRSHCITVFTLHNMNAEGDQVRESRLQFFDLMGSERFKGANAAHDTGQSSKSTMSGWEGIFANMSLSSLIDSVRAAAVARRKGKKILRAAMDSVLNEVLAGSLKGNAITGMMTNLSQHPRNGNESALSVSYSADMSKLLNDPAPQPFKSYEQWLKKARVEREKIAVIVRRGVAGKYQAKRAAELLGWKTKVDILESLAQSTTTGGSSAAEPGRRK